MMLTSAYSEGNYCMGRDIADMIPRTAENGKGPSPSSQQCFTGKTAFHSSGLVLIQQAKSCFVHLVSGLQARLSDGPAHCSKDGL